MLYIFLCWRNAKLKEDCPAIEHADKLVSTAADQTRTGGVLKEHYVV